MFLKTFIEIFEKPNSFLQSKVMFCLRLISICFLQMLSLHVQAQEELEILQDSRIDSLTMVQSKKVQYVYRLFIAEENNKKEIDKLRATFRSNFPDKKTSIIYFGSKNPKYLLKVGDFEFQEDALLFRDQLKSTYNSSIHKEAAFSCGN